MAEETALRTLESSSALAAIERERFHSYSQLVRNLHWLAAALVVLWGLLSHGVKLSSVLSGRVRLGSDLGTLLVLAAAMVLYTLALHSRLFARFAVEERMWAETGLDLSWITGVVLFTGATRSPFFFLYYIVLYATTPAGAGRRQTYGKAMAVTLLVLGVILPLGAGTLSGWSPSWEWLRSSGDLVWPLAGVWLVAYFSAEAGTLGAHLHQALFQAAHTDALTGLPNLRYFTIAADLRGKLGGYYTIVMVDADHLKQVNDTYGHAAGSELGIVADAIRSAARSGDDLCSRIGGDEFIVRLANASEVGALASNYLEQHPLRLAPTTLMPISVSMGVAAFPKHGRSLSEVTHRADQALYRSKQEGRARDNVWAA